MINLTPPFAIYGFVLAGGQLISAAFEAFGSHKTAVKIQGFVGKMDIVDRVGDSISDFYIQHPKQLLKILYPTPLMSLSMSLSPAMQESSFGFMAQELHIWGMHDQAEWVQNTGKIVVEKMMEYEPKNFFNNYFGFN